MSTLNPDHLNSKFLRSVVEHVFLPPTPLPGSHPGKRKERKTNVALCNSLIQAAQDFLRFLPATESPLWIHMIKMMELARRAAKAPFKVVELQHTLSDLAPGDVFCIHIRAQNAALVVRRPSSSSVQFEVFEVSPLISAVTKNEGKLLCSYPGPAIEVPMDIFVDKCFLRELSSFLVQMDVDHLDHPDHNPSVDHVNSDPRVNRVNSTPKMSEVESVHPRYISELLVGILRAYGQPALVDRITKRIGDEVIGVDRPWRRSPLWLVIRVSLQTSLRTTNLYKPFMLFFHAYLLRTCVRRAFPSELLYAMRVKMARRMSKLSSKASHHVIQFVHDTANEAEELLSKRWTAFQAVESIGPTMQLNTLDFVGDTHIPLRKTYDYLMETLRSATRGFSQRVFMLSSGLRICDVYDFAQLSNGLFQRAVDEDQYIAMADFELCVERNLELWTTACTNNSDAIDVVASCIEQYFASTKKLYKNNAEDNSIMILTVMDLWVALDKLAIQECPLLRQYSPEIPSDFLHGLLLHRSSALQRALRVEEYLCRRHDEALDVASVFSNGVDDSSFPLKYFSTSGNLQRFHNEICTRARRNPVAKRAGLVSWNEASKPLLREAKNLEHEKTTNVFRIETHSPSCRKCQLEEQAKILRIPILEWSLLRSTVHTQLAAFELSPPRAFAAWRDITYMIIFDIGLRPHPEPFHSRNGPEVFLDSFSGIHGLGVKSRRYDRVTIGSSAMLFSDLTDSGVVGIPVEEPSTFVDNGLSFKLFDRTRQCWLAASFSESNSRKLCTPPVSAISPYGSLHRFVSGTQHTPNEIIGAQANCPGEINIHEFIAFSGLRSGPRLQWFNIARELASPFLSFRREEVHTLITQAAWQLGPLSNRVREWHVDLGIASFGNALLRELESLLGKIPANWQEEVTVRTIALICSRLLVSTTDPDVCSRAYALMREARNVTYQWIIEVRRKLDSTQDEASRTGLQHRLCMLAATCLSTFDVCPQHVHAILSSKEDFSIAMQCAVFVGNNIQNKSSLSEDNFVYLTRMLGRYRRILNDLEPMFRQPLPPVRGRAGLLHADAYDDALTKLWVGYSKSNPSSWHVLPRPKSRWISCVTEKGQKVHYNLLTGELLIGGKRLGRLPSKIVDHSTYESIFGKRIVDVVPADIPGMDYMTRSVISGYKVLFSLNNEDLVLQARKDGDPNLLQLIPRSKLPFDLPSHFVSGYIHWLDLSTGELEFRLAASPWTSVPSNWRLCIQKSGILPCGILEKLSQDNSPTQLIDTRSRTFKVVSHLLSPLESPKHIIITYTAQTLEVSLPRLRLSFFVNKRWELECQNMAGYVIDKTRSCGTMFGLRNKLILRPSLTCFEQSLLPRRVIIPVGNVSYRTEGGFTRVAISYDDKEKRIPWYEYAIDTDLRCLRNNATLKSKLFQCYLHALTSHCLPDPLLGHTGTEEALYMLRGAGCRSFQRLDIPEVNLLIGIASLSPSRYYAGGSTDLQSMVNIKWNDLPALNQHHDFSRMASSLIDHVNTLEAFYDRPKKFPNPSRIRKLLNRAAYRNEVYYPSDLRSSEPPSSPDDVEYSSRDVPNPSNGENVAYRTSWSMLNAKPSLDHALPELWDLMNSWDSLGPARRGISLRYSRYWLEFDAARDWFAIYDLCRKSVHRNGRNVKIELSFSLSAGAFTQSRYSHIIPLIIIFALDERFCHLSPPPNPSYTLSHGLSPVLKHLKGLVFNSIRPLNTTSVVFSRVKTRESQDVESSWREEYDTIIERESSVIAESIFRQWPDHQSVDFCEQWFDKCDCIRRIEDYRLSISCNVRLEAHVLQLQGILGDYRSASLPPAVPYTFSPQCITSNSNAPSYSLCHLLLSRTDVPTLSPDGEPSLNRDVAPVIAAEHAPPHAGPGFDNIEILIKEFRTSQQPLLQLYGNDLDNSNRELSGQNASKVAEIVPSRRALRLYHEECSHRKGNLFSDILAALSPSQDLEETNRVAGLWPRITPRSLLGQLAQDRIGTLPDHWKTVLTRYAISFLKYQQSLRLLELSLGKHYDDLLRETQAIYNDMLTESTPDWLLVQIEANFVARPNQVAVARTMISPTSKRSISLQLNMGEGKSSVIVPLVASTLANGSELVRVITLKPLASQMFQILVSRLSGLPNRPIFYIPISRGLRMKGSVVRAIRSLFERCVKKGGVLVVQPEHILSLKLMYIDILLKPGPLRNIRERSITRKLRLLQDWLVKVSRDVLDESDEILHVHYQLVYSAGKHILVDDHPNRWITIQQVFGRLQIHAMQLNAQFPEMFEVDTRLGGIPTIQVLDSAVFQRISSLIIDDALRGEISNLPLDVMPSQVQAAARRFMAQTEVSDIDHELIHSYCAGTTLFSGILLLRGLLMEGEGVLCYVLKERRWRVDYGLYPKRTTLAVPYRAKDVASLRAEFAHPDVAISLTCLSYYYGGLTKDQVLLCLELVTKLDNPEMEYDYWVAISPDLPAELRRLRAVNVEDLSQVNEFLVPVFSRNKRMVDFYLNQQVFPRAAREFQSKLPTSAWDLVEDKANITTGFSGTNDSRYLLPTSITQEDPEFALGTNALVLQHLLLPQNDHYQCTDGDNGEHESAAAFLRRMVKQDPEIRVLLDVGAQMLELENKELAKEWLSLRPDVSAAIFFNDDDNLTVITQDETIEPFISSPFNRQLDKCVVYLDDSHTRGTDLKLPEGMRAAVMLGPKVTKDKLVQGCMRMRQLGKGHSVMFFAPGEVDRRIRSLIPNGMAFGGRVSVLDVVRWTMHETCEDIGYHLPFWALQGLDHHKRFAAYEEYRSGRDSGVLRNTWLQSESQTLEEMYWTASRESRKIYADINSIPSLRARIDLLGVMKAVNTRMVEEQEREVNHEVDPGRDVGRPKFRPAKHIIEGDIRAFIETGNLPLSSICISSLFAPINMSDALDSTDEWSPSPFATKDFTTTNSNSDDMRLTKYLRPINWILSSRSGKDSIVVVISPHEVNELLPIIRKSVHVRLHIYAPRVTPYMRSFSNLDFYTISDSTAESWSAPAHVITELNLFAGQLYFDNKSEYDRVCTLLALSMVHPEAKQVEMDGFVLPAYRTGKNSPFAKSQIAVLKKLMHLRRKGMDYHRTHMGQMLNGKPLNDEAMWELST